MAVQDTNRFYADREKEKLRDEKWIISEVFPEKEVHFDIKGLLKSYTD